jgi:Glycosyl hydrolase family 57
VTHWAQLLHFYQPPTQTHDILRKVADESYRPLLAVLAEHPKARIAINMNAVLTELLHDHGMGDILATLRMLVERGQVEIVGSGRFHPILPLIPEAERVRSIREQAQVNARLLGAKAKGGFFPPEMCYSAEILPSVASAGYDWVVLSGVACPAAWPLDLVYRAPAGAGTVSVLFRDDLLSNRISFRETRADDFVDDLGRIGGEGPAYVLTAMDAETYGHHLKGWEREFLDAAYEKMEHEIGCTVTMVQPGELPGLYEAGPVIQPLDSSWSTSRDDITAQNPYPLWRAPGNEIHEMQWEFVEHALQVLAAAKQHGTSGEAKKFMLMADEVSQPALHSCQFWWASRRPMWDVPMVYRGLKLLNDVLLYAAKSVRLSGASEQLKRELAWRTAAANETRARLERTLFLDDSA